MNQAAFPDLRAFLAQLRRDGDVAAVDVPVDPYLEAAEIHRRVIAAGGPALLFTRPTPDPRLRAAVASERLALVAGGEAAIPPPAVEPPGGGYTFPLVTNLLGTARRAELAFGRRPQALLRRLVELAETLLPPTPGKLWGARDVAAAAVGIGFRKVGKAPVREVVESAPDLRAWPITTSWAGDGAPFLTLPLVYTEHPGHSAPLAGGGGAHRGGAPNLGIYRMQVHGPRSLGVHWQIGKGGGFHYKVAEARGEALPVTVLLGGPPALILAAIAPLPENVPELMLASLLLGERVPRTRSAGPGPHPLVATAEAAIWGTVAPRLRHPEGPFGDHYGYYSLRHEYPVLDVAGASRRRDAILPATVVGKPRQEDFFIGDLLQELLSPLFPLVMPGVEDLWSYGETGYHSLAAAVVKERYRREAMVSAFRILGEGQLALTKFLLVVDRRVDLRDFRATLEHLLARTRPETDLYVLGNLSMDTLDYTGPRVNEGSKGVWLGLGEAVRELPRELSAAALPPGIREAHPFCAGCLVLGATPELPGPADPGRAEALAAVAAHPAFAGWPLLVLADEPRRAAATAISFLWTTFTRFEPAADVFAAGTRVVRHHVSYTPPVLIDARTKPGFPAELFASPAVAEQVSRRWHEYFPGGGVAMGDSALGHLDRA